MYEAVGLVNLQDHGGARCMSYGYNKYTLLKPFEIKEVICMLDIKGCWFP